MERRTKAEGEVALRPPTTGKSRALARLGVGVPVAVGDRARPRARSLAFSHARAVRPCPCPWCPANDHHAVRRRHTLCNVLYLRRTRTPPVQRSYRTYLLFLLASLLLLLCCHGAMCADICTMQIHPSPCTRQCRFIGRLCACLHCTLRSWPPRSPPHVPHQSHHTSESARALVRRKKKGHCYVLSATTLKLASFFDSWA